MLVRDQGDLERREIDGLIHPDIRRIKKKAGTIPIVFVTATGIESNFEFDRFVTKPVAPF